MTIQVNATDYASGVQIESFDGVGFSVPAWDECGLPDLSGDVPDFTECDGRQYLIGHHWSSVEAASAALANVRRMGLV